MGRQVFRGTQKQSTFAVGQGAWAHGGVVGWPLSWEGKRRWPRGTLARAERNFKLFYLIMLQVEIREPGEGA